MESETKPFGKELRMAMPQEIPDGHRTFVGQTSGEGPSTKRPYKSCWEARTPKEDQEKGRLELAELN